jgi:hypothetical protein
MRKRLCVAALVLLSGIGSASLLACGDKFVGVMRGTRFQQAPRGRQETILIYTNPASDVSKALAGVSVDAAMRGAGYRAKIVATAAEFERELTQGAWDLVLVGLPDAQAVSKRTSNKVGILPVALGASDAEVKQIKKQYPVVLSKATTNDGFVRVIEDALASRSKAAKVSKAG